MREVCTPEAPKGQRRAQRTLDGIQDNYFRARLIAKIVDEFFDFTLNLFFD